jgi:hypothetical protein
MRSDLEVREKLTPNSDQPSGKSRRPFWTGIVIGLIVLPGVTLAILWAGLIIVGMLFSDEPICGGSPKGPNPSDARP